MLILEILGISEIGIVQNISPERIQGSAYEMD